MVTENGCMAARPLCCDIRTSGVPKTTTLLPWTVFHVLVREGDDLVVMVLIDQLGCLASESLTPGGRPRTRAVFRYHPGCCTTGLRSRSYRTVPVWLNLCSVVLILA